MERDSSSRYGIPRGLFMSLCTLLIFIAIIRSCGRSTVMVAHPAVNTPEATPQTVKARQTESTAEAPAAVTNYRITPIHPQSGEPEGYSMVIEECHRSGDLIRCSGKAINTTDARGTLSLRDSVAVDDQGRSTFIGTFGGGFSFPGMGNVQNLMPNVPTRFEVTINDPHLSVKALNLQLSVNSTGDFYPNSTLVFEGIPVQ
jgi:hypothetical protein